MARISVTVSRKVGAYDITTTVELQCETLALSRDQIEMLRAVAAGDVAIEQASAAKPVSSPESMS